MRRILYILILLVFVFPAGKLNAEQNTGSGYAVGTIRDLALIYQGGNHRIDWTEDQFVPYVTHTFADGRKEWLFDGFLFLEFTDGKGGTFCYGYTKKYAKRKDWEWLLNRIFEKGKGLDALDKCIESQKKEIGNPPFKHKIVLSLVVPLPNQTNWGRLNGMKMNFKYQTDKIRAVKWYIDQLTARFNAAGYKNLELEGFYWLDEDMATCKDLPKYISGYIHDMGKKFMWIPYWNALGYRYWKELGFDIVYQQPNHFFARKIPDIRLDNACKRGQQYGMGMEFECDSRALIAGGEKSLYSRMEAYINAFERHGVYQNSAIAYYLGSYALLDFFKSTAEKDKQLVDRFAKLIVDRRKNDKLIK